MTGARFLDPLRAIRRPEDAMGTQVEINRSRPRAAHLLPHGALPIGVVVSVGARFAEDR